MNAIYRGSKRRPCQGVAGGDLRAVRNAAGERLRASRQAPHAMGASRFEAMQETPADVPSGPG
jgi:hypothetical protein